MDIGCNTQHGIKNHHKTILTVMKGVMKAMYKGKWIVCLLTAGILAFMSSPAMATIGEKPYVDSQNSGVEFSGFLNKSEITYKYDDDTGLHESDDTFDVERTLIGLTLSKGMNEKLNVYGTFSYLMDGTYKDNHSDGGDLDHDKDDGYMLSAGAKYKVMQSGNISGHIYGQLDYILEEKYTGKYKIIDDRVSRKVTGEVETSGYELAMGAALKYQLDTNFAAYAAMAFTPFADLTYNYKASASRLHLSSDGEIERDDQFGFRIGASYDFTGNPWFVRSEVGFGSEQAFLLSFGTKF